MNKTHWMTCEDVAEALSVKVATVWAWIREGKLKAYRLGRMYRIDEDDVTKMTQKEEA